MKLVAALIALACAAPAFAQSKSEADAAYKLGQQQYLKQDYEAAAISFKAAYAADPDPVYLYNVAQAYRLGNKCLEAGEYYRRFLLEAKKAPNEDAVKAYIVEVDDCARKAGQTPVEVKPKVVEPPKEEPTPKETPIDTTPIEPRDEGGGSNKRLFSYILGGAGLVAVGVGVYSMTKIRGIEDDALKVCNKCEAWEPGFQGELDDYQDQAKKYEVLMVSGFVVGGAAITAGVVLFVLGGDSGKESPVTFTPTRDGATASYKLEF